MSKNDEYYMKIAMAVREKANCTGRKVGAVIVKENRIISTGYNGTPEGLKNCEDGGCVRCRDKKSFQTSVGYDVCVCVHAEENAIVSAGRFGAAVEGATIYSTLRPCFGCSRLSAQAKIVQIRYLHDWTHPLEELDGQYRLIQGLFKISKVDMGDPDFKWASGGARSAPVTDLARLTSSPRKPPRRALPSKSARLVAQKKDQSKG